METLVTGKGNQAIYQRLIHVHIININSDLNTWQHSWHQYFLKVKDKLTIINCFAFKIK